MAPGKSSREPRLFHKIVKRLEETFLLQCFLASEVSYLLPLGPSGLQGALTPARAAATSEVRSGV